MSEGKLEDVERAASALSAGERLKLIEYLARSLRPTQRGDASRQKEALSALRRELATLPVSNRDDGITNRDHDRILYGDLP